MARAEALAPRSLHIRRKRQQGDVPRPLDRRFQQPLMRVADAGDARGKDLPTVRNKLKEQSVFLVVDVIDSLHAELADFSAAGLPTRASSATTLAARTSSRSGFMFRVTSFLPLNH